MDWMKHKKIYFAISGIVLLISIFALIKWNLRLGIDFTGGTTFDYKFSKVTEETQIEGVFKDSGIAIESIDVDSRGVFEVKAPPISSETKNKLDGLLKNFDKDYVELKYEVVGPSIGPELVKKTVTALVISASVILLWVAYQFKNIKYGLSAVLAMLHDSIVLLGAFSLMGHFMKVEVDFLFVTAMLTILSFSVHDTIVVFDRIREVNRKTGGNLVDIANIAVTQTMVRSLNNSFTIIFMLVALALLGGDTIKWFAVALLIGTVSGTYSSPFVAVPLLVTFDQLKVERSKLIFKK
jgi:preprotein translocase subunit SecF